MRLFVGISELVQPHAHEGDTRAPIDVIENAALLVDDEGHLAAAGPEIDITRPDVAVVDLGGRAVVPGLIDSHTHVVHAGERIDEFARRARGETYEQIALAGGGIIRSIEPLRAATVEELVAESKPRVERMVAHGTTTVEVKSGYGMNPEAELKQLRAAAALGGETAASVLGTVLAHVVPPERRDDCAGYVDEFGREVIRVAAAEGLASYCDVFVENVAFTPDETRNLAAVARGAGLGIKLHVDQLHDSGGAALAAELGALSADHLEMTGEPGRRALAGAGVVATILPGCALFLGTGPWPDGRALRDAGCEVAVATDCNPGSSMILDLGLCATAAATRCGLSLEEAIWGATRGGAKALGLDDRGRLVPGERADFVVLDHHDWRALLYRPGDAPVGSVFVAGKLASGAMS